MKKQNARRILAFVLALMLALPVLSIPTFAQNTTVQHSQNVHNANASKRPDPLFFQDFETFDVGANASTIKSVISGPSSAKIVTATDGLGNVLQIDCAAVDTAGKYFVCLNNNKNIWIEVIAPKVEKHPIIADDVCICENYCLDGVLNIECGMCSKEGADLGACQGIPKSQICTCYIACTEEHIYSQCPVCTAEGADLTQCLVKVKREIPCYMYLVEGTFKPASGNTYMIEGQVNEDSCSIQAVKVTTQKYVLDEEGNKVLNDKGVPITEWVEIPFSEINYNGYKLQDKKDANGNVIKTEKLETVTEVVYVEAKDENGNVIMEQKIDSLTGLPCYTGTSKNPQPLMVPKMIPLLDENGNKVTRTVEKAVTKLVYNDDGSPKMIDLLEPVLDENGEPVMEEKKDSNGNTVYTTVIDPETGLPMQDENGNLIQTPIMIPVTVAVKVPYVNQKTGAIYDGKTEYNGKIYPLTLVPAKEQVAEVEMVNVKEEVLATNVESVCIAAMKVRDAYGGGQNNVAKPANMQTTAIRSDVLVFSTDYYFSKDDPETPDVDESLSRGMDIRISTTDAKGTSKNFDFLSIANPSKDGTITLKAHSDAPTEILAGTKTVPLGTWVNILVVADFTSGIYVIYVNGELMAARQNVKITEQTVDQEVLDENGNVVMVEKLDKDGNVVMKEVYREKMQEKKDENGNTIMIPAVDADGTPIVDENNQPVMVPEMEPVTEIVYTEELDANGNVVMVDKYDENGMPVWENGKPVQVPSMVPKRDEDGNIVTQVVMEQVFTNEPLLDEEGKQMVDENGNPMMKPLMEPVMVAKTEKVKKMLPDSSKWVGEGTGLKAASWNLGHFLRGGSVSDYRGYMQIDNTSIYDGKDLPALFEYLGYSIDYNEDYEKLGIGDLVPMSNENATASVQWDEAGEEGGNKAVKVVYSENVDYNYLPPTAGATYLNSTTVVLEANYYLPNGTQSQFQSQLRKVGAVINDQPFANYPLNGEKKDAPSTTKTNRTYDWVDLYWVKTTKDSSGNTNATLNFTGSKNVIDPTTEGGSNIALPVDEWIALSTVIDLKTGAYTLYVNGVERITGNLVKSMNFHENDGTFSTAKVFELQNITFGPSMWIVSKVNKNQQNIGHFYVDDVMMTKMGDLAGMERVEGMLSADIYANGKYVKTVTDNNVFFTSQKITIENRNVFDLKEQVGTDQLLKADEAMIRFTSPAGIRFASKLDVEALNKLYAMIAEQAPEGGEPTPLTGDEEIKLLGVSFGTLIVPTDTLRGNPVTFEALDAAGIEYLDVQGTKDYYYDVDGDETTTHIVGSIVNLKEENIGRLFSAVNYVRVILPNGVVYNIYANRAFKTSAQSLADDAWGEYTPAEQAVIDAYFACVKPACDTPKKEELNAQ